MFVDPWGYKGVTRELFKQFVDRASWGRDAMFFFNLKRINAALSNDEKRPSMDGLFGASRVTELRERLAVGPPRENAETVHAAMVDALNEVDVKFVHRFDFVARGDSLFFITQSEKGLRTIKGVMVKKSRKDAHGVPDFAFEREPDPQQRIIFEDSLDTLRRDVLERFAGETVTFEEIVRRHHPGTNYVETNYRSALRDLETRKQIAISAPTKRPSGTFGPKVLITFPKKK